VDNVKIKQIVKLSILGLIGIGLSGCSDAASKTTADTSSEAAVSSNVSQQKAEISFVNKTDATPSELPAKSVTFEEGASLMDVMKENFDLKEDNGMITSIEGLAQDEAAGYYWTYTINDQMINTGAKDTVLKENDKVVFTYEKF
jgi:guanyl-specific ribonuclease Sa